MDDFEKSKIEIEDLLENSKIKKKKNGCRKGKRTERELCKLLTGFFKVDFNRSVGSGNRWGQVNLSENAKQVFTGDISVPEGFRWVIESKGGYEKDIDLNGLYEGKIGRLDDFIEQSKKDSKYCGRKPIICWKRARKPWLSMILIKDLKPFKEKSFTCRSYYNEWLIIKLQDLLDITNRDFWFEN